MLRLSGVPPGPIMLNTVQMYNKGAVGGPCWGAGQLCLIDIRSLVLHVVVLVCCLGTSGQTHPPTHSHQLGVNIPPNYQISESSCCAHGNWNVSQERNGLTPNCYKKGGGANLASPIVDARPIPTSVYVSPTSPQERCAEL